MLKKIGFIFALFVATNICFGQMATVTGTVSDTGGLVWTKAQVTMVLQNPSGQTAIDITTGQPVVTRITTSVNVSGAFSVQVNESKNIVPSGTQWVPELCPFNVRELCQDLTPQTINGNFTVPINTVLAPFLITPINFPAAYDSSEIINTANVPNNRCFFSPSALNFQCKVNGNWVSVGGGSGTYVPPPQINTTLLTRYPLADGSGTVVSDTSGNGNQGSFPGGTGNPTWTLQGILCNGTTNYVQSSGTSTARTFVWSSTLTPYLNNPVPAGDQFVSAFGVPDLSMVFGGNGYYGSHPATSHNGTYGDFSNDTLQGTHTFALTLGTNTSTDPNAFYVDGVLTTYMGAKSALAGFATTNYQICGVNSGFNTYSIGNFYYWETYSGELTPQQIQLETNVVTQIVKNRGVSFTTVPVPTIKDLYVSVGDSLTNGEGVNPSSQYITPTDTFDVLNYGLGNADTDDLFELFDARDAPLYRRNAGRNVIRLWVGTNDVSTHGRTPQQTLDGIRSYCRKAKGIGFQTILSNMISRVSNDTNMIALDTLLTQQNTGCDLVIDLASNPLLGAVGAYANTTYYQVDQVHLTQLSQQTLVASAETRAINLLPEIFSQNISPTVTTTTYNMVDSDLFLPVSNSATVAVTLPDCTYFTNINHVINNLGTGVVNVTGQSGQLINGSASAISLAAKPAAGSSATFKSVVSNRTTSGCAWITL